MPFRTADLCDAHESAVRVAEPIFRDYGGEPDFCGPIATVKVYEDNVLVRRALETPGRGRVLVVDGGGSLRYALVGDMLAGLAQANGWAGIVVNGCVRDAAELANIPIGIKALATNPLKSKKGGAGEIDVPVTFAGLTFAPGEYLYADGDGVLVATSELS